jgi:hypothetical protein
MEDFMTIMYSDFKAHFYSFWGSYFMLLLSKHMDGAGSTLVHKRALSGNCEVLSTLN